jgi:hypothetical protein
MARVPRWLKQRGFLRRVVPNGSPLITEARRQSWRFCSATWTISALPCSSCASRSPKRPMALVAEMVLPIPVVVNIPRLRSPGRIGRGYGLTDA